MKINEIEVNVDVREELEAFEWERPTWKPDKLIACSPFRDESAPSFYVWLEDSETASAGMWQDSGSFDPTYSRGGFVKLLAYLRHEPESATVDYLLEKYAGYVDESRLQLNPHPKFSPEKPQHMNPARLDELKYRHPYLERRGIAEHVQRSCKIGYDGKAGAVSIPHFDPSGKLVTIKYRSVTDKRFWYDPEGAEITRNVWGLNFVYKHRAKTAVLVEAEIDAMYLMSCGYFAIATGNKFFNRHRADLIAKSPIERLIIGRDNDAAGAEMREKVVAQLDGRVRLADWELPDYAKDINDVKDPAKVREIVESATDIRQSPGLRL